MLLQSLPIECASQIREFERRIPLAKIAGVAAPDTALRS